MYNNKIINFYLSKSQEVRDILLPLLKILSIEDFSFYRIYANNNRIFFSNSIKWVQNYFDKDYFLIQDYYKIIAMPHFMPWSVWPENDLKAHELMIDAYKNFNIGTALSIHIIKSNYIDIFSLRSTKGDQEVICRYLTNLGHIEYHIAQFLKKAEKIILEAESLHIIEVPKLNKSYHVNEKKFMDPVSGKKIFTVREEECLREMSNGKTAKQIADIFDISYRTVEMHIANIKLKLNVNTKSEVINKILSNENNYIQLF